ncbi:MAG: hypothetical protein GY710_09410 [Desulfobacteraceae bacterium]|nr:hypothetical protein [Desulfobacteraceae bacterium]
MDSEIKRLLKVATGNDQLELTIFQNAVQKNLKNYHASPTKKAKNDLDAARDSLKTKKEEMMKKYLKPEPEKRAPSFPSLRSVLIHLENTGFKISKSKLYRDRDKGMIRVNPDNSVLETEVRAYASTLERKEGDIGDLNDMHAQKTAKEVESLELKVKKQQFDFDREQGKYLPRKDFEAELAARAVIFETGLKHLFNTRVGEWIALVGGKPDKAPDLLQLLHNSLETELSNYATTSTFQVMFEEE